MTGGTEAGPPQLPGPTSERSRRQLLGGGVVMGGAALLAGCTSKVKQPSNVHFSSHTPQVGADIHTLNGLLALEYRSIYAYEACIPLLPQPPQPPPGAQKPPPPPPAPTTAPPPPLRLQVPLAYAAAQQFLTQELRHVTELTSLIVQAKGHPVQPAASYDLGHPKTKQEVLTLLHQTEERLLKGYVEATGRLTVAGLRGAAAAIMGNHAQHSSVLRLELGLAPIPSAFVSGAE